MKIAGASYEANARQLARVHTARPGHCRDQGDAGRPSFPRFETRPGVCRPGSPASSSSRDLGALLRIPIGRTVALSCLRHARGAEPALRLATATLASAGFFPALPGRALLLAAPAPWRAGHQNSPVKRRSPGIRSRQEPRGRPKRPARRTGEADFRHLPLAAFAASTTTMLHPCGTVRQGSAMAEPVFGGDPEKNRRTSRLRRPRGACRSRRGVRAQRALAAGSRSTGASSVTVHSSRASALAKGRSTRIPTIAAAPERGTNPVRLTLRIATTRSMPVSRSPNVRTFIRGLLP